MAHRRQDYFLSNIIRKTLQLDFKLPFKEDNRLAAVEAVLIDPRFAHIKNADREVIRQFARYLALDGSRVSLLVSCLRHRFFRPGFMHKARVIVSLLTTRRYSDKTNT